MRATRESLAMGLDVRPLTAQRPWRYPHGTKGMPATSEAATLRAVNQPLASRNFTTDFRARFSADEFEEMIELGAFAGMKVELLNGELDRMTPPMSEHGRLRMDIGFALRVLLAGRNDIRVYGEVGIRLGEGTIIAADAAIARSAVGENRRLRPDEIILAVEIAHATLSRDLGAKRNAYAAAGVPDYWVIDVTRRLVHRFTQPTDGEYLALATLRFGEAVPVPGTDGTIVID